MIKPILNLYIIIFSVFLVSVSCQTQEQTADLQKKVVQKYRVNIPEFLNKQGNPRTIEPTGEIRMVKSTDWTSGFYPGCLWYLYELTGDSTFKSAAQNRTQLVEPEKLNGRTHDMGFKVYCSFGNGYRLTNNSEYKAILLQSAKTLITRYNPKVGCIRSWDHHDNLWEYPVIIDNMMNLELLFWAFRETGDSIYYNIANTHALTTLKNHYRNDFSSYHVVNYDTLSGEVKHKHTHQGIADESAWARGQAWGLYGFTMAYRETGNPKYLNQAKHIAAFIINNKYLPQDGVPYWDYNDPKIPDAPRDASAAAVTSSALYELCLYANEDSLLYKNFADKILSSLSNDTYLVPLSSENPFLLDHSTGNMPANDEIDCSIIYADYYYLEALLRKLKFEKKKD